MGLTKETRFGFGGRFTICGGTSSWLANNTQNYKALTTDRRSSLIHLSMRPKRVNCEIVHSSSEQWFCSNIICKLEP